MCDLNVTVAWTHAFNICFVIGINWSMRYCRECFLRTNVESVPIYSEQGVRQFANCILNRFQLHHSYCTSTALTKVSTFNVYVLLVLIAACYSQKKLYIAYLWNLLHIYIACSTARKISWDNRLLIGSNYSMIQLGKFPLYGWIGSIFMI